MTVEDAVLARIEELLKLDPGQASPAESGEVQMAALNTCTSIYGRESPQAKSIELSRKELWASSLAQLRKHQILMKQLQGLLREVASDIKSGRVRNFRQQAQGEVLGDLLTLAREALSEDRKDVASVLACAALEDALKKFAAANGLQVYDKEMAQVVNALKSASLVQGPQGAILHGFVKIRNKAFHAQWNSLDVADVQAVIGFTQKFLLSRFGTQD